MPALPGLRWWLLLPALAIFSIGPAGGEAGRRPQCNELGSWRVCYNATMQLTDASRLELRREIEKDGRKIGGSANLAISIVNSQLRAELQLSFLGASYPVKVVADGEVVDTISPAGNQIVDLKRSFGEALQRLRLGDEAKKLPPVKNLKVVMVVDREELVLLDAALAHTEEAIQGLFRAAVMLGTLSPRSELARDVPSFLAPGGREQPRGRQPDAPPGKGDKVAKKSDAAPRPPAVALPTTVEECKAIPDAVAARLRRLHVSGIPHSFYYIDRMYLFGSEAILAACAEGKFDQASFLATEVLGRQRDVRQQERFYQASVRFSRQLSGMTLPVPRSQDECQKTWGRILTIMPVDDIDGDAQLSQIRNLCARRAYARAHEEMSKYIDREVRAEIERITAGGPGGPFGSGRSSR